MSHMHLAISPSQDLEPHATLLYKEDQDNGSETGKHSTEIQHPLLTSSFSKPSTDNGAKKLLLNKANTQRTTHPPLA